MRLEDRGLAKSHPLMVGQGPHDHHPQGTFYTVIINSQAIAGLSSYQHRHALGRTGYKTLKGVLRGPENVDLQGHTGCFFLASDVAAAAIGISNTYSSYVYMGAFSRLHGDSYLSKAEFGNVAIVLRDAWIDGTDAVLEFYNTNPASKNLTVYGTVSVK